MTENEIKEIEVNPLDEQAIKWLEEESEVLAMNQPPKFEQLPALKLVENKITEIEIDFSKPFQKHTIKSMNGLSVIKAIIPCKVGAENKIWWMNIKNPVYKEIIDFGKKGKTKFKIFQVGNQNKTQYKLVD